MKILILGGSGYIGRKIIDHLLLNNNDIEIIVFDKKPIINEKIIYTQSEFNDLEKLSKAITEVDLIIHLISSCGPRSSVKDIGNYFKDINNTVSLLELMVKKNVNKIIFISSGGTVYGNSYSLKKINENHKCKPISTYGLIKYSIEEIIRLYQLNFNIKPIIFRVSNVYGPDYHKNNQGVIPIFIENIRKNNPVEIWGDGKDIRDYIFINDLLEIINKSIYTDKEGIFNIGSGKGYSLNQIVKIMKQITRKEIIITYKHRNNNDSRKIVLDIKKAKKEFNWTPKTTLKKGVQICWDTLNK
jgi:UDP-glucose 4-epimerase